MKKYLLLVILAVFAISCSKKVEVKGKVTNHSPLERVEIIEASGVGTLPLMNVGLNSKGEFSGSFDAPKDGMYVLTYAGNMNMVYLKRGQTLQVAGNGSDFPSQFVITGDAKANNDFLKDADKSFQTYASNVQVGSLIGKDEKNFVAEFNKIQNDIFKTLEDAAKKYKADDKVLQYKKNETKVKLMGLLDTYEQNHGPATNNPSYKPTKLLADLKAEYTKDGDQMVREFPMYREYLLSKINGDFQTFAGPKMTNPQSMPLLGQLYSDFLKTRKEITPVAKDYILAYVISQSDINPMNGKNHDKVTKLINDNISDAQVKKELLELQTVIMGQKSGSVPDLKLISQDGKTTSLSDLKGKPTVVMFYASWNPNIGVMTIPSLKDVNEFYKSKANFAYVNLDDTKDQFTKTSTSLLKGFTGNHYYVDGGINSEAARKFGLYGFKTPSYLVLDKEGKLVGRPYFNLGDEEFVQTMEKQTGLKAPAVQTQIAPQFELMPENPAPQPAPEPAAK